MEHGIFQSGPIGKDFRVFVAILCAMLLAPGEAILFAQEAQPAAAPAEQAAKLPPEQLDSLVAPIALYPDPLLSQTLVASTYPLEIIQLQQWLGKNKGLKDQALVDAVKKQNWDPSVQAMASLPDVVKRLGDDIKWTTDLGNAFLAQQSDVMDAVQRMRAKAQGTGNLKSSEQQKVETKVVENKTVIVVEQANPQVIYVPTYNPTVVYPPPVYPYPPIYYPPPPPPGAYVAGMAVAFGVGIAMGAAYHGGWGYHCGWGGGGNNVYINNSNNYVNHSNQINRNTNVNRGNTNIGNTSNNWQHNPQHRGGAPYSNQATANKYGGSTRGGGAQAGTTNRGAGAGGAQASTMNRGGGAGGAQAGTMDRGGGGNQVGNRSVSNSPSASNRSAFGGGSGGASQSSARASSQRGASSMSSSRGGGGGGGRGGGGGGRRR